MDALAIGFSLRSARLRSGWTLNEVAAAAGVSASMISMIERGKKTPSLGLLERVSAALGAEIVVRRDRRRRKKTAAPKQTA